MELVLVRHGQSQGNVEGRLAGQRDYPLTECGREQAEIAGRWLAGKLPKCTKAVASPLLRARDTAEICCRALGLEPPELWDDLMELDAGALAGLNFEEIEERFPDRKQRGLSAWGDFGVYGGESYEDVQRRVQRLTARLLAAGGSSDERVLLVAHGGLLVQFLKSLSSRPVARHWGLRFGNCTAGLVRVQERGGERLGFVQWLVPVEFMASDFS